MWRPLSRAPGDLNMEKCSQSKKRSARSLLVRGLLLISVAAGLAACATTLTTAQFSRERARVKAVLVARGDPASQITAALLAWSWSPGPPPVVRIPDADQLALAQRATELAPADPAIAWARVALCLENPGCDDRTAVAHFRAIDPTNAAGWLPDLAAAAKRSPEAVDTILAARIALPPRHGAVPWPGDNNSLQPW